MVTHGHSQSQGHIKYAPEPLLGKSFSIQQVLNGYWSYNMQTNNLRSQTYILFIEKMVFQQYFKKILILKTKISQGSSEVIWKGQGQSEQVL
jgi:hypothetical protein